MTTADAKSQLRLPAIGILKAIERAILSQLHLGRRRFEERVLGPDQATAHYIVEVFRRKGWEVDVCRANSPQSAPLYTFSAPPLASHPTM